VLGIEKSSSARAVCRRPLKGRQHTREHKRTDGYIAIVEHKLGVPVQTHKTVPDFAGHVYHIVAHPVDSGSLSDRSVCLIATY